MEQSILKSTKKVLQIGDDDASFDLDVMTHINSAFSTLNDLGVGPAGGFMISDETPEWSDFLPDGENDSQQTQRNRVKTFVWLSVRLAFDPPAVSYLLDALQKQLEEVTVRISMSRENSEWVDPNPTPILSDDTLIYLDGGGA